MQRQMGLFMCNLSVWLLFFSGFCAEFTWKVDAKRGCLDVWPLYCKSLKKYLGFKVCRTTDEGLRDLVTTKCIKTCGFCRQMYPIHCRYSRWGCCWDKVTPMDDRYGWTCPRCRDRFPHVCQQFKFLCKRRSARSGDFLRLACPVTCRQCRPRKYGKKRKRHHRNKASKR